MLTALKRKNIRAVGGRFAIVASQYNGRYVDAMLRAAKAELKRAGVNKVQVVRVPGAFEIPVAVARLAASSHPSPVLLSSTAEGGRTTHHPSSVAALRRVDASLSAIICLGVILRGQTVHAAHIGEAVSRGLMQIQLQYGIPVIHEVLLLENEQQARERCLDKKQNRGAEAAQTALAMAGVMENLRAGLRELAPVAGS